MLLSVCHGDDAVVRIVWRGCCSEMVLSNAVVRMLW